MATSVLIGAWVAAGLTLFMFSFLYKDNPFFRFGEHLYVGVSMGYTIVRIHYDVMMKSLYNPEEGVVLVQEAEHEEREAGSNPCPDQDRGRHQRCPSSGEPVLS